MASRTRVESDTRRFSSRVRMSEVMKSRNARSVASIWITPCRVVCTAQKHARRSSSEAARNTARALSAAGV